MEGENDPPLQRFIVWAFATTIIGLFIPLLAGLTQEEMDVSNCFLEVCNETLVMQENTFIATSPVNNLEKLVSIEDIIFCESSGNPKACNLEYGCIAGMGLVGFIPSTWNETLDRMIEEEAYLPEKCNEKIYLPVSEERTEAIFDAECNLIVGKWLLAKDGDRHWRPYSGYCYLNGKD